MASKTRVTPQKEEMLEKEGPETPPDSPLIERSNAFVRALIRTAKKRGYVTHDQINSLMKEVNSEQIENVLAMFSEMGINVVESEEAETEEVTEEAREEPEEEESEGELVEVARTAPAETKKSVPGERTDDPVRMYLREMKSVELLSREGEIAIAKRIESGREAMIAGLCESPLTFQAIIIWRDELNDGKVFLRDIIDLEATYAGLDAKGVTLAPADGAGGAPGADPVGVVGAGGQPQTVPPAEQGLCVVWLFNEVHSPGFYRLDGNGNIGLAGYDDHRPADPTTFESAQEFKAGDLGHSHIADYTTSFGGRDGIKKSLRGLVGANREISRTQQEPKSVARSIVIVDHMDHWTTAHW
jgi:hypothetical protein